MPMRQPNKPSARNRRYQHRIVVYLDTKQLCSLIKRANADGQTVSTYVRALILRDAARD